MRGLKRVLHLIVGLGSGGAEAMLTKLVSRLDRDRFESVVVSMTDRGVFGDVIEREGTEIVTLGIRRGVPDPRAFFRFHGVLRAWRPHIIQSWMYHADVLAALAGRRAKIPVLWNVRCSNVQMSDYSMRSAMTVRVAVRLSHWPAGVVVNSMAGRRYHEEIGYRPRSWHFIPNGFDVARFRPDAEARRQVREEIGVKGDTPLVGAVARFDPMKDYVTLFAAASEIVRRRGEVELLLTGPDVDESNPVLRELSARPELQGRVHMLAYRGDVERIMAALDVLVLSSYSEGFPNRPAGAGERCRHRPAHAGRAAAGAQPGSARTNQERVLDRSRGRTVRTVVRFRAAHGFERYGIAGMRERRASRKAEVMSLP